ncbi:MAG: transposase [Clostridiales bacterium]|nr:transposase [Clostridiales bacterium]
MNILQKILIEHYEEMIYLLRPRKSIIENVDKMIHCGDPSFGGAMYCCTKCNEWKFTPFRCHSRFCPSCGNKYSIDRTTSMASKVINVQHRHCVFTIAEELRSFFLKDRSLLNLLFSSVRSVVLRMFHKDNKAKNFTPGVICVLHTFGRDLKWNPHIHCLISEGGFSDDGFWRSKNHFNYTLLRDSFQTALLNELQAKLGDSFKKVKSSIYKNHKNGFYVYAKPRKCNPNEVMKYIGRYLGRPVIATSRIDQYNGENVTFHYNRHEDDKYVVETIPAIEFIQRLIQHIPEKHFKMIRYYGLYARNRKLDKSLHRAISKQHHTFLLSQRRWRNSISASFGYDPLQCPCCKNTMVLVEIYYNHHRVPLEELYQKAKEKYLRKRPPNKLCTN